MKAAAKFFIYLALASPLLANRTLFFPFITGKALFFRSAIELALVSFVIFLAANIGRIRELIGKIRQPLFVAIALFALVFVLTSLTAVNKEAAFWSNFERGEGGWQIIHYFLFFALVSLIFSSKKEWLNLIRWHVIVGFFIAVYGFFQYLKIWPNFLIHPGNISGSLGNPSYLALYLIFSLFFIVWLLTEEKGRFLKILWLLIGGFDLFMIFQTGIRASFLALSAGLVIIIFLLSRKFLYPYYLAALAAIVLIIAGSTILVLNTRGDALAALQPRFWTWSSALAGFLEKPLLGWGTENFPYVFDKYYNANHFGIESWFDRSHNIFLEYLIGGGLILLAAYLSIFFFFYKQLRQLTRDWFWPILFGLPIIYLINGLTLFEVLPIYLNLFLFFAFFLNYHNHFRAPETPRETQKNISSKGWAAIFLAIFLTAASWHFTVYRPLQKNRLLIKAIKTNDKTMQEVFENFRQTLVFYSPIGQAEIDQQFFGFVGDFFDWVGKQDLANIEIKADVETIARLAEETFNKDRGKYLGVKNSYLMISAYLKAYNLIEKKEYLEKAKLLAEQEISQAPTRIEIIRQQLQIAELEQDEKTAGLIREKIKKLRPDL